MCEFARYSIVIIQLIKIENKRAWIVRFFRRSCELFIREFLLLLSLWGLLLLLRGRNTAEESHGCDSEHNKANKKSLSRGLQVTTVCHEGRVAYSVLIRSNPPTKRPHFINSRSAGNLCHPLPLQLDPKGL